MAKNPIVVSQCSFSPVHTLIFFLNIIFFDCVLLYTQASKKETSVLCTKNRLTI